MCDRDLDDIRQSVLDRMERGDRLVRGAILGAAAVEALLIVSALMLMDWGDRLHRLVFVLSILSYTIVIVGMFALAGHITRGFGQLLGALAEGADRPDE